MAHLLKIPPEIHLKIYKWLDNIDDALHLARTCKSLHPVFEFNRLKIFTSIINNGDHYDSDVQLHLGEVRYATFGSEYEDGNLPDLDRRPLLEDPWSVFSEETELSAEAVWSIVCRWHAMKVLFDLYCDSGIRPYYLPFDLDSMDTLREQMALDFQNPLPYPSCRDIEPLGAAEKQGAYERFYLSRYHTSTTQNQVFDAIRNQWYDYPARDLEEKIDAVEVVDFVWGFLGHKIFWNPDQLSEWLHGEDATGEFLHLRETIAENWLYFVRTVAQYLRPPQIIELLSEMWKPRGSCFDRGKYLHRLGIFDISRVGFPEIHDDGSSPEWFFHLKNVESGGMDCLIRDNLDDRYENQWEKYRYSGWRSDFRGQVLFSPEAGEQLLHCIRNSYTEVTRVDELDEASGQGC